MWSGCVHGRLRNQKLGVQIQQTMLIVLFCCTVVVGSWKSGRFRRQRSTVQIQSLWILLFTINYIKRKDENKEEKKAEKGPNEMIFHCWPTFKVENIAYNSNVWIKPE